MSAEKMSNEPSPPKVQGPCIAESAPVCVGFSVH